VIRARVAAVHRIQTERYQGENFRFNGELTARQIEKYCILTPPAKSLLQRAFDKIQFSARAYHRVLKVARTIADMEQSEWIDVDHVAEALTYRAFDKKYWGAG
jgi:magnesium chelatase family protein